MNLSNYPSKIALKLREFFSSNKTFFADFKSVSWNIFLISLGSLIYSIGVNGFIAKGGFINSGLFGTSLSIYYATKVLSPSIIFLLLNIPLFILGGFFFGKRFILYSLYGLITTTLGTQFITLDIQLSDKVLQALAGGVISGAGSGIILRSMGSGGGLDILGIILYQRYNIKLGQFYFAYNCILFVASYFTISMENILLSILLCFLSSMATDYFMSMFNARKMILIISDHIDDIAQDILKKLNRGGTFILGEGVYSGAPRKMLMTVVTNLQLKKVEDIVFSVDPKAFFIVENTFNVLGKGFSHRKTY